MNCTFPTLSRFLLFAFAAFTVRGAEIVIYDNGSPDLGNAFGLTQWIEAGQFTLTSASILTDLTFWDAAVSPTSFTGSMTWQICANSSSNKPGAVLFSGASSSVARSATGSSVYEQFPEYIDTFSLPSVSLPPGNYWLTLHNGPLSTTNELGMFWETTSNGRTAVSLSDIAPFNGNWQSNSALSDPNSQLAFHLSGVPAAWAPRVTNVAVVSASFKIAFTTANGQTYRVDYKDVLTNQWATLPNGANVFGNGGSVTVIDTGAQTATHHRFYRVVLQ